MSESSRTTIEMARCFKDRREALSLIHSAYVRAGLPSKSENALRVTKHQLLPRSRIFVAKSDCKVVSTLSLIPDSPAGLPLDSIDHQQVDELRGRGLCIAEIGCFADRRHERGTSLATFCSLARFIAQYALAQGIDVLVIVAHPGCARFLKNFLGFKEERSILGTSPSGIHRPAAALLLLEFERLKVASPEMYEAYFADSVPLKDFAGGFMPRWEADYFGRPCAIESTVPVHFLAGLSPFSTETYRSHAPTL